jgi:hypothetical protein
MDNDCQSGQAKVDILVMDRISSAESSKATAPTQSEGLSSYLAEVDENLERRSFAGQPGERKRLPIEYAEEAIRDYDKKSHTDLYKKKEEDSADLPDIQFKIQGLQIDEGLPPNSTLQWRAAEEPGGEWSEDIILPPKTRRHSFVGSWGSGHDSQKSDVSMNADVSIDLASQAIMGPVFASSKTDNQSYFVSRLLAMSQNELRFFDLHEKASRSSIIDELANRITEFGIRIGHEKDSHVHLALMRAAEEYRL